MAQVCVILWLFGLQNCVMLWLCGLQVCVYLWLWRCTCVAALWVALADGARALGHLRGQGVEGPSHRFHALILRFVYEVCQLGLLCLEGYNLGSLQGCCPVLSASSEQPFPIFGL